MFTEATLPGHAPTGDHAEADDSERPPRRHHRAGREREELRPDRAERLHVPGPPRLVEARDPRRRRGHLQREGPQGEHAEPQGQEAHGRGARTASASGPTPSGRSSPSPPAIASSCSRAGSDHAPSQAQAHQRRPPVPDRLRLLRDHEGPTREVAARPQPQDAAVATPTAARRPATAAAATSASTAWSTSSAPRTACRPRSRPSSTTRTATAASCCCTTTTARRRYILAPRSVKVGDRLQSGQGSEIRPGNALPLRYIPVGTTVHNVELRPGQGGKMARSAGSSVQLVAKEGDFATLRLPSTEMRRVPIDCRATVGEVGNAEAELVKIGKAGRNRWKGVRPQTRGVAMNPVDHPHGGGEGKTSGGRHPVSPWGKPEGRTRDKTKPSQKLIVRRRRTGRGPEVIAHAAQPEEGPVRRRPPAEEGRRPQRRPARRRSSRPGRAAPRSSPRWSATPSPCTTGASTCPCTSPSRWWATSSASSRPTRTFRLPRRPGEEREGPSMSSGAEDQRAARRPGRDRALTGHPSATGRATSRVSSAYKAREVLDLIRGRRRPRGRRDPAVRRARHRHRDPQGAGLGRGQRPAQRRPGPRGALRLGVLRRRGPHAEAVPARARGRATPHPQAHLPHHDHREPA